MNNILLNLLERFQHLSDYAETKLGVLITFNTALIFGLLALIKDQSDIIKYFLLGVILFNAVSLFFAFSGVYAKRKNSHSSLKNDETKNYYYYKYVANLNEFSFLDGLIKDYALQSENSQYEKDLSNQIVVLAKNADRKFRYFNIAMGFTIASLITPLGLLLCHIYNNPDWLT
jgi:hypothetical protein